MQFLNYKSHSESGHDPFDAILRCNYLVAHDISRGWGTALSGVRCLEVFYWSRGDNEWPIKALKGSYISTVHASTCLFHEDREWYKLIPWDHGRTFLDYLKTLSWMEYRAPSYSLVTFSSHRERVYSNTWYRECNASVYTWCDGHTFKPTAASNGNAQCSFSQYPPSDSIPDFSLPRHALLMHTACLHFGNPVVLPSCRFIYSTMTNVTGWPPEEDTTPENALYSVELILPRTDRTDFMCREDYRKKLGKSCNIPLHSATALQLLGSVTAHNIIF